MSRTARPRHGSGRARRRPFLHGFLDAELARLGLTDYAIMGFSQGAMMSLFAGLRRAAAPRAILAFSGALVAPELAGEGDQEPRPGAAGAWGGRRSGPGRPLPRCRDCIEVGRRSPVEAHYIPRLGHGSTTPGFRSVRWRCRKDFRDESMTFPEGR